MPGATLAWDRGAGLRCVFGVDEFRLCYFTAEQTFCLAWHRNRSEVGGVYFNGLFCGRQSKRTYNGVRLGINLAVEHNRALESGVWELWITVEPAVHHFSPVDW